jgi:hypothetical protein
MKRLKLNYVVHFHDVTGKPNELYHTEAKTARDLIMELDSLYPGFASLLIKEDGSPKPQNVMIYSREGMRARNAVDFSELLEDGDNITFL